MPSSVTSTVTHPFARRTATLASVAWAYFATLASASATTKYAATSTGAGQAPLGVGLDRDRNGRAGGERVQRGLESALGEDGRVDAARELAQLGQARLELDHRPVEQRGRLLRVGLHAPARVAQQQGDAHQARLRPVVQVALEAPALGVARLHEPRPGGAQLDHSGAQIGVQARDVAAQQPGQEGEGEQRGGGERGPPRGVARAGERGRREQEGQQPEDVDRRELKPLELTGPPPAHDEADEHDHEEDDVERDLSRWRGSRDRGRGG